MSETCDGCHADATHFLCDECLGEDERGTLRAEVERLREALRAIAEYQPREVVKDDFAYDRMVRGFQDAARAALAGAPSETRREQGRALAERLREALRDIASGDYSDPLCMRTPEERARMALDVHEDGGEHP